MTDERRFNRGHGSHVCLSNNALGAADFALVCSGFVASRFSIYFFLNLMVKWYDQILNLIFIIREVHLPRHLIRSIYWRLLKIKSIITSIMFGWYESDIAFNNVTRYFSTLFPICFTIILSYFSFFSITSFELHVQLALSVPIKCVCFFFQKLIG